MKKKDHNENHVFVTQNVIHSGVMKKFTNKREKKTANPTQSMQAQT